MAAQPWTKKHSPKLLNEVLGHSSAIQELKRFVEHFKPGKAAILHGSTGTGKTVAVLALAHELGYELVEVNASDERKAASLHDTVGAATKQMSLFNKGKIILIDEVDGISGNADRGGVPELVKIIQESKFPIICTANDPYDKKFSTLRKKAVLIEFPPLHHSTVLDIITRIANTENIKADEQSLKTLARQANGDARSAINDLQAMSTDGTFTKEDLESLGDRDRTDNMNQALLKVFKTTDVDLAKGAFDNVNEDVDKIFLWVEENLPKEYTKNADLARGFDMLSEADRFFGRIRRWQYYRFYVYCYALLSAGIASAKDEKYSTFVQYKPTSRILKIWIANQRALKKKAVAAQIGEATHTSSKRAREDTLPFLQAVANTSKGREWAESFGLSEDELAWLAK
ncbi:MAG: replication factor C large subunit [Candidatus Woesearchaeota archaeon]